MKYHLQSINIANTMMGDGGGKEAATGIMIVRTIIHIIDRIVITLMAIVPVKDMLVVNSTDTTSHERIILLLTNAKSMAIITVMTTTVGADTVRCLGIALVRHSIAKSNQVTEKKCGPFRWMWPG
mmetsp:Transcript_4759/g.10218  ORF Transcript_4759/g.10218 Transcript_4759/m.10218 type:complete len:125 (-) Transcript_4759:1449-1823(-)